ncbi:hypothetical protein RJT34_09804 [Clitoria ternatea]|uniref:Fluoride ion transporter CrcB n=1 Tax=Clitoria ternatea TaxID=43366 RepID=A0AAN9PTG9_CLITE
MMERMSSWGSALSRLSVSQKVDDDAETSVSEVGDTALHVKGHSEGDGTRLSFENTTKIGGIYVPGDNELQQFSPALNYVYTMQKLDKKLPKLLDYVSCVFDILGVLTRYLLEKLLGPGVAEVTSDQGILYPDLPSNMVGYLLMGWFGVVFKADISRVSEHLAIALTTGYLGSLTTFSGWNQKMLALGVAGHWLLALLGFFIGMILVAYSIILGVETAKGFKWFLSWLNLRLGSGICCISKVNLKVDSFQSHFVVTTVMLVMLGFLWGVSGALEKDEFKHGGSTAQLWFACLVGPLGVWIRWFLARINGRGIGAGMFRWLPFGTLIANVSAACVMAALATLKKSVNTTNCDTIVTRIQFGLLGCLSTVSTFAAEFNATRESHHPWRAYVYAMIIIGISFSFGILIYGIPVWRR